MRGQKHHNNFDIIRILAALQVLYGHAIEVLGLPAPTWWVHMFLFWFPGVPIFFMLSGFLVVQSFQDCDRDARPFWIRRALRLFPGLFTNLLVILVLLTIAGNLSGAQWLKPTTWLWLLTSTAMGSDFYGNIVVGPPFTYDGAYKVFPSGVLWTISVEIGFYLLVPLTFSRIFRTRLAMTLSLIAWAAFSLLASRFLQHYWTILPMQQRDILFCSPFPNYWIFLIGAAVRLYWDELRPFLKGWGLLWFAVYVTLSAFLFLSHNGESVEYQRVTPFIASRILALAALIFSTAFTLPNLAKILRGNDLSYGVYLYHMPVVGTLIALGVAPFAWLWIVVLAATFALAALSWRLIEKPARKLRGRMEIWTKVDQASHPTMAAALPRLSSAALPGTVIALGLATAFYWTEATGRDFRGVISDAPFYTLAPSSSGEALGGAKVAWDGGKMVLTTDETTFGNQWRTPEIGEANGGDYLVAVDVSITGGQVGIGILDAPPSGQWIHTIGRLPQGRSLVRVKAPGTFAVVIFNSNGSPANVMARVDQLTVSAIR